MVYVYIPYTQLNYALLTVTLQRWSTTLLHECTTLIYMLLNFGFLVFTAFIHLSSLEFFFIPLHICDLYMYVIFSDKNTS